MLKRNVFLGLMFPLLAASFVSGCGNDAPAAKKPAAQTAVKKKQTLELKDIKLSLSEVEESGKKLRAELDRLKLLAFMPFNVNDAEAEANARNLVQAIRALPEEDAKSLRGRAQSYLTVLEETLKRFSGSDAIKVAKHPLVVVFNSSTIEEEVLTVKILIERFDAIRAGQSVDGLTMPGFKPKTPRPFTVVNEQKLPTEAALNKRKNSTKAVSEAEFNAAVEKTRAAVEAAEKLVDKEDLSDEEATSLSDNRNSAAAFVIEYAGWKSITTNGTGVTEHIAANASTDALAAKWVETLSSARSLVDRVDAKAALSRKTSEAPKTEEAPKLTSHGLVSDSTVTKRMTGKALAIQNACDLDDDMDRVIAAMKTELVKMEYVNAQERVELETAQLVAVKFYNKYAGYLTVTVDNKAYPTNGSIWRDDKDNTISSLVERAEAFVESADRVLKESVRD